MNKKIVQFDTYTRFLALTLALAYLASSPLHSAPNAIENMTVTDSEDKNGAILTIESKNPIEYLLLDGPDPIGFQIAIQDEIPCDRKIIPPFDKRIIKNIDIKYCFIFFISSVHLIYYFG